MFTFCAPTTFLRLGCPPEVLKDEGYTFSEILRTTNRHFTWKNRCEFDGLFEKTVLARLPKQGAFLVVENDHVFCVIDGVNHNNLKMRNRVVEFVFEILAPKEYNQ